MGEKVQCIGKFPLMTELDCVKMESITVPQVVRFTCNGAKQYKSICGEEFEKVLADTKSPPAVITIANDVQNFQTETSAIIENEKTPHSNKRAISAEPNKQQDEIQTTKSQDRVTPLPVVKFADSNAVWLNMIYKEEATMKMRSPTIFSDRSAYLPRMRAILLDWLMEVCEVYHLRRTTYYLTVDYIDRYLTMRPSVPKTQLQLLGVSCLFIAAKFEEIYPPKLSEFSYVCDGACTEGEILSCELLLLNTLSWDINPMTPTSWLNLYMQILQNLDNNKKLLDTDNVDSFEFPQYSAYQFVMASQLIDLFSMDPGYLRFSYSVIAAGAFYYIYGKEATIKVSGLRWDQFRGCVEYMSVFNKVLKRSNDPRLKSTFPIQEIEETQVAGLRFLKKRVPGLVADELHCLQTHVVDLDYFEEATILRVEELGYQVEKIYIKKIKKVGTKTEKATDKEGEEAVEETTAVMYEVENTLGVRLDKKTHENESTSKQTGGVNLMKIETKATISFDDILSSMHNDCYDLDRYL